MDSQLALLGFAGKVTSDNTISWAIKNGHIEMVWSIIGSTGLDPKTIGYGLRVASRQGHVGIVELLLAYENSRADTSVLCSGAIQAAADGGHTEVVKLLLTEPRVDPSESHNEAIRWACASGRTWRSAHGGDSGVERAQMYVPWNAPCLRILDMLDPLDAEAALDHAVG